MNVNNNNPVQGFSNNKIPSPTKTAKTRLKAALNAIQTPKEFIASRKMRAAIAPNENWLVNATATKYSTAIKLLTAKVEKLGKATGEDIAKNMLSTQEVCLLLCCWELFNSHGNKLEAEKLPPVVKELMQTLVSSKLLHAAETGNNYTPWFPHDQISFKKPAIKNYIEDIQSTYDPKSFNNQFGTPRFAIPSFLLEIFSPVVLIPQSRQPPFVLEADEISLLKILTPVDGFRNMNLDEMAQSCNCLAKLVSNPTRRDAFLQWWKSSPLHPAVYKEGETTHITAPTAFFARPVGAEHLHSGIDTVIRYLQNTDDESAKLACQNFILKSHSEPITKAQLASMNLTSSARKWLETIPTSNEIHLNSEQHQIFNALNNGITTETLSTWLNNPDSLQNFLKVISIKDNDIVYMPGVEIGKRIRPFSLQNHIDILRDLPGAFQRRLEPEMIFKLRVFTDYLLNSFGSAQISATGGILEAITTYTEIYLTPLNEEVLTRIDLRLCDRLLEAWPNRDNWTVKEYEVYSKAFLDLCNWRDLAGNVEFPKEITDRYPKIKEVQKALPRFEALLLRADTHPRWINTTTLKPQDSLKTLNNKINALMQAGAKSTDKKDRLTIKEFYFLKEVVKHEICPLFLTEETFLLLKNFSNQYLSLPKNSVIALHFINPTAAMKLKEYDRTRKDRIQETFALFVNKIIGAHVNISTKSPEGKVVAHSVWTHSIYHKELNGFINPKIDSYELNLDVLAQNLPEDKREAFKAKFPHFLNEVATQNHQDLTYPDKKDITTRMKSLFRIQPKINPSTSGFSNQKTTFCSEFVIRSIMDATVRTYKDLGEEPPDSGKFFGLKSHQNLYLLTPAALERRLKKKGLISRLNNIEQIIRF